MAQLFSLGHTSFIAFMTNTNDSKERVAYDLMVLIINMENQMGTLKADRASYLKLYAECLKTVSAPQAS